MEKWEIIKLSEVLKEKTERNKNNETDLVLSVTNSQGFVKQSDFFEGTVHSEDISNYKLVRKNEFAYNPSRINVGSIDILKDYDIGALSPMYVIFSVDENRLLPDYFKYYFQTHKFNENVKNNTQGSVRNSLSFKALSEFEYLLPPLEEQKRIVKILDQVNKVIEKYQNLINEKEQFIKSQFVEMFGNVITNDKKWDSKQWKQVLTIKNGKSQKDVEDNNGRYPIYGSGGIIGYANDYICNGNTIIIGRKGSINKPFVVYEKFWNVDTAFGIEPIFNKISLSYLYMFCLIYNFNRLDQASTIPSLTKNDLLNIKIPVPPINIQSQFEQIVKLIDKQKFELGKQKQNYIDLKKGLMQQLLTGKLKV